MRTWLLIPALTLLLAAPGCGTGNIGDLFSAFPRDAFGDGTGGGDGGGGPFQPSEVASLGGSDGVNGDVKNVVVVPVGDKSFAFLAAATNGVHVVDVSEPDLLNRSDYVRNVPAVDLAGGRCDALAAVDSTYLVCVAVGGTGTNHVTVLDIALLVDPATAVADATIPPAPGSGIAVPGNADGRAGGVSGSAAQFFVATGGPDLAQATIDPGTPAWVAGTPVAISTTPAVARVLDVVVNQTTALYASVLTSTGTFGIVALGHPALPIPTSPSFTEIEGEFATLGDQFIAGPGNFPLDLALDGFTLYASGDDQVEVLAVQNPVLPNLLSPIPNTGPDTIAVAATGGQVAVGANDFLRVFAGFGGAAQLIAQISFPGTINIRGIAFQTTDAGTFVLCCGGTSGGLRVVQLSQTQR